MQGQEVFLKELKDAILAVDAGAEVILYGSRARGDYKEDSDWDLLVLMEDEADYKLQRRIRDNIFDAELKWAQAVSTIIVDKATWDYWEIMPLHQNVKREGRRL